jgi:hypothetical protein
LSAKFYLKLSEDLFKYLRALETLITGHAVWSQHTKRYKRKANGKGCVRAILGALTHQQSIHTRVERYGIVSVPKECPYKGLKY